MRVTGSSQRLWHGLTTTSCCLLAVVLGGTSIAGTMEARINSIFGTQSSKVVSVNSGETESRVYFQSGFASAQELVDYRENLNKQIEAEGSVLLKNENNALPLGTGGVNVTVFGIGGVSPVYAGAQGGGVIKNTDQIVPIYQVFTESGIHINETVREWYRKTGIPENCVIDSTGRDGSVTTSGPWDNEKVELATRSRGALEADASAAFEGWRDSYSSYGDAAIVMLCRLEGEGSDLEEGSLSITKEEQALIDEAKQNFDKVIVILNGSAAMEIEPLKQDPDIDSILWIGEPGTHGLYGVADILTGRETPSGHLPDTYAVSSVSSPAWQNAGSFTFSNAEAENLGNYGSYYLVQAEGIYLGYKYYETRYEDCVLGAGSADSAPGASNGSDSWNYDDEVSYGFGYGLSYTTFTQTLDSVEVDEENKSAAVTVTVTNTGTTAGKDAVQIYAQSPYTDYDRANQIEKAAVQLMAFDKTQTLEPGESETLTIDIDLKYLASYDYKNAKTYIMEAGDYYFSIGNGAHDALNHILAAKGMTSGEGMDYDGNAGNAYHWSKTDSDMENYSFAFDGETKITNQLEDADYNYWKPGTVTYLSRNDWSGTWSDGYDGLEATSEMIPWLTTEIYEAGSSDTSPIVTGSAETSYNLITMRGAAYDDELWESILNQMTADEMAQLVTDACEHTTPVATINYGGSLDKDGPIGYDAKFNTDTEAVYHIDGTESDYIRNYNFTTFCTEPVLAASFNPELAKERGRVNGEDSLWSGYTEIWAPGCNLHRTPYSGRNYEYFSEDAMLTNLMAAEICAEGQRYGSVAGPKHFAFNDQETNRQGVATFMNEQAAREIQLRAFEGAFLPDEGGSMGTMTAFNRVGVTHVTYSEPLQVSILRDEWGFEGYTITDFAFSDLMYPYASITSGTNAFDNMISDFSAINAESLKNDLTLLSGVRESCHRILYTYVNSNAMNGVSSNSTIVRVTPWWKAALNGISIALAALAAVSFILYLVNTRILVRNRRNKEGK